jgi:hypothetical protein
MYAFLYFKNIKITQPKYGVKSYKEAGSKAMAVTIMQYFKTFVSERILTNCAMVQCLCLIATYTTQ